MEAALAIGPAPPRPGLAAPTRYSHLRRPGTLAAGTAAARRPFAAAPMETATGGRPSPAPARCTRAETDSEVDEAATSSPAAEAEAAGATEPGGNGSPTADAATEVVAGVDGIRIRRRPVTGPAVHYVGPFQFRLENEGNTPRNILEKIVWDKDAEVSKARPLG
ncbi:hypothetical protein U9M48_032873 [Paspalum notatum var. saurae]|uniref:Uncharacterized protein n=1 Tax=Paspalum notatum var. saurae TaxID=547442 RepID=A0AAQ3UA65_PASNO